MNKNFENTMANCRTFIRTNPLVESGFENQTCSVSPGFELTLTNGCHMKITVNNSEGADSFPLQLITVETFPGILIRKPYIPMAAEYCQSMLQPGQSGYLCVNPARGAVYHHGETWFRDSPTSAEMLAKMAADAIAALEKQAPVLQALAQGHFPSSAALLYGAKPETVLNRLGTDPRFDSSKTVVQELLKDGYFNSIVSANLREDAPHALFLEAFSNNARLCTFFDWQDGRLILTTRTDQHLPANFRAQASQLANEMNDDIYAGYLTERDGYMYATVSTFLPEDPTRISRKSLEHMSKTAASLLLMFGERLAYHPVDNDDWQLDF